MSEAVAVGNAFARFLAAVDRREWDRAERLMTNPFHLDYSSFGGGDPENLEPAEVLTGWQQILPGFDHTHHQIGNLEVDVRGDKAEVHCYLTATHQLDNAVWTVVGTYANTLAGGAEGWKVSGIRFEFKYQTGDLELPEKAQRRLTE